MFSARPLKMRGRDGQDDIVQNPGDDQYIHWNTNLYLDAV